MQDLFKRIYLYYHSWKLKINTSKCETILFRPRLQEANKNVRKTYKNFFILDSNKNEIIPHKNVVKYLGINLDERLHFNRHVEIQLNKARQAFIIHKRLFFSKHLHSKIKLICYQLLIRPIITYGCAIWYNISASIMEKIRLFERKCIRTCLGKSRTSESNYTKYINNKEIYDTANITRIDNYIIKLIRDHYANAITIKQNSLIFGALYPNENYFEKCLLSGFVPPEAFLYLDAMGYIQDKNNIPIIYHIPRHSNDKKIDYIPHLDNNDTNINWKYCRTIPKRDINDTHRQDTEKYWWLE